MSKQRTQRGNDSNVRVAALDLKGKGNVLAGYKYKDEREVDIQVGQKKRRIVSLKQQIKDAYRDLDSLLQANLLETNKRLECKKEVDALTEDIDMLRKEVGELERRSQEKAMLRELAAAKNALSVQLFHEDQSLKACNGLEARIEALKTDLRDLRDEEAELDEDIESKLERDRKIAAARKERKFAVRTTLDKNFLKTKALQKKQVEETKKLLDDKDRAGNKLRRKTQARLRESLKYSQKVAEEHDNARKAAMRRRTDAILSLKSTTDAALSKIIGDSRRRAEREERAAVRRAEKIKELAETHANPKAALRTMEAQKDVDDQRRTIRRRKREKKMALLNRKFHEDKLDAVDERERRRQRAAVDKYTATIQPEFFQRKYEQYIRSKLKDGDEFADLTYEEEHFYGSKKTTITRKSFGLGRASDEVLERKKREYPEAKYQEAPLSIPQVEREPRFGRIMDLPPDSDDEDAAAGGAPPVDPGAMLNDNGPPSFRAPAIGAYMQRKLAEAKAEREAKLARGEPDRKILGKTYKGSKFLCTPAVVTFKDFVVQNGKVKKKVVLTNVSFGFNHFKIVGIEPKYADLFQIKYKPVGRMSAGLTAVIHIYFTPVLNKDIFTHLNLLAETGPFKVPIQCLTRKADLSVKPLSIDLGCVVVGETLTRRIGVTNAGDLTVDMEAVHDRGMTKGDMTYEGLKKVITFAGSRKIGGYGKARVVVVYKPVDPGEFDAVIRVRFGSEGAIDEYGYPLEWGSPSEFLVRLTGSACLVPVYVEKEEIDFQYCLMDKLYRTPLVLKNRSNVAQKMSLKVPKPLRGYLKFTPSMGFIQTGTPLAVAMQFNPRSDGFERALAKYPEMYDAKTSTLDVKLEVITPGQTLPVFFRIKAILSPSSLLFSLPTAPKRQPVVPRLAALAEEAAAPPTIDFGRCYVSQSVTQAITIRNTSDVLQRGGFVETPAVARVLPTAFFAVLPGQTITRHVVFSPAATTRYRFSLTCKTDIAGVYKIKCRGDGIEPTLLLRDSVLRLAAAADGHGESASTFLTNRSDKAMVFKFGPYQRPAGAAAATGESNDRILDSHIKICPEMGVVPAKGTVRLQVDFRPRIGDDNCKERVTRTAAELRAMGKAAEDAMLAAAQADEAKGKKKQKPDKKKKGKAAPPPAEEKEDASGEEKGGKDQASSPVDVPPNPETSQDPDQSMQQLLSDIVTFSMGGSDAVQAKKVDAGDGSQASGEGEATGDADEKSDEKAGEGDAQTGDLTDAKGSDDAKQGMGDSSDGPGAEPWSRHGRYCVTLFAAPEARVKEVAAHGGVGQITPERYYLSVETTAVQSGLQLVENQKCLNFGQVICGKRETKAIELRNVTDAPIAVRVVPFPPGSPFRVLNSARTVQPGKVLSMLVDFAPSVERLFAQQLVLENSDVKLQVGVVGQGVRSHLEITHDTQELGYLHAGDLVCGDFAERAIRLKNCSGFPFNYRLSRADPRQDAGTRNDNGRVEFDVVPAVGKIDPGKESELKCTFQADVPSFDYKTTLIIGQYTLPIRGRCHKTQLFVLPPVAGSEADAPPPLPADTLGIEAFPDPVLVDAADAPLAFLDAAGDGADEKDAKKGSDGAGEPALQRFTIPMRVPPAEAKGGGPGDGDEKKAGKPAKGKKKKKGKDDDGPKRAFVAEVTLGSCVVQDKSKSSSGSFELGLRPESAHMESSVVIEPQSGNLGPGDTQKVVVRFDPAAYREARAKADDGKIETDTVKVSLECKLKGGYAPGGAAERSVELLFVVDDINALDAQQPAGNN